VESSSNEQMTSKEGKIGKERGDLFERQFRSRVGALHEMVPKGPYRHRGQRKDKFDIDAGVPIGDELIIFECKAQKRPLDYALASPRVMKKRQCELQRKLSQLSDVVSEIKHDPHFTIYDFSRFQTFTTIVVSPFVEWIWSTAADLWLSADLPRIMSASEAIDYLQKRIGFKAAAAERQSGRAAGQREG
jgi:hypothetical protein